jgi:succinate dehydrogenase/fumarate reductase flavoprotein subunit
VLLVLSACVAPGADTGGLALPILPDAPVGEVRAADDASTSATAIRTLPEQWSEVPIVIGAGPSGLTAAMDLGDALVLEAADVVGGRARYAGGFLFLVGTEEQAALGIEDGPALAEADWEALTGAPPTDATRAFLAATDGVRDRLVGMGLTFTLQRPSPASRALREHGPTTSGRGLVDALAANLPAGVEVRVSTPVRGLVFVDGAVAGVRTDDGWIGADTVVIASGGFMDRADLVQLHTGWSDGGWRMGTTYGDVAADGSALDWAADAGLGTANLGAIGTYRDLLALPGADGTAIQLASSAGLPWVWVDTTGTRFIDESATWSVLLSGFVQARTNVWAVTTRESIEAAVSEADLPHLVEGDGWRCADDWEALGTDLGVDAAALVETMATVDTIRARTAFDALGRPSTSFSMRAGTPCAFRPGSVAAKNFGGLAVDDDGRVLDAAGAAVPGLWAVGEAAGMGVPGMGGAWGFDGSLSAVLWSGWRTAAAIRTGP